MMPSVAPNDSHAPASQHIQGLRNSDQHGCRTEDGERSLAPVRSGLTPNTEWRP
jgi:hypothetical protein